MKQFSRAIAASFFVLMASSAGQSHAAGSQIDLRDKLVPHKALYDIKMVSRSSSSQILNISGKMFYETRDGCDAWTTDHRFNLFYEYADSPPIRITSDFSTYETHDGKSFDFSSRRKRNGDLYQEIRGRADLTEEGGEAVYSKPDGLVFDLKNNALFPMAHSLEIMKQAEAGKKFYSATIFDGSDEEGPVEINTFIGGETKAGELPEGAGEVDESLLEAKAWDVRMAFFPLIEPSEDAEYEMDVVFHDNGVISDMVVEYRDFSVTQKLMALETLEAVKCGDVKE